MVSLFGSLEKESWQCCSPREELYPLFEKFQDNSGVILKITSNGKYSNYGEWYCFIDNICESDTYRFSVEYAPENIPNERHSIYAVVSWMSGDAVLLERNYIDDLTTGCDGWRQLIGRFEAPGGAAKAKVELAFRWSDTGTVTWRKPVLSKTAPIVHRKVRVATTYITSRENLAGNLAAMLEVVDKAGRSNPDIICLTENFYDNFLNISGQDTSQEIPGDLSLALSRMAKKHNAYIVFTMNEKSGGDIYNTAVLLGRNGQVVGKYRKIHIPLTEAESGITPGDAYGIFNTDFGRIGIMTCWDQAFPETARILRLMGAEIIFLPTIGDEPLQQMARAKDNGIHIVVSGMAEQPNSSRIINPLGRVIAEVEDEETGICTANIDLEHRYYSNWLSLGPCDCEPHDIYIKERRPEIYEQLVKK